MFLLNLYCPSEGHLEEELCSPRWCLPHQERLAPRQSVPCKVLHGIISYYPTTIFSKTILIQYSALRIACFPQHFWVDNAGNTVVLKGTTCPHANGHSTLNAYFSTQVMLDSYGMLKCMMKWGWPTQGVSFLSGNGSLVFVSIISLSTSSQGDVKYSVFVYMYF